MLSRILSVLKSGAFWAGFAAGAVAAIAFPKVTNAFRLSGSAGPQAPGHTREDSRASPMPFG